MLDYECNKKPALQTIRNDLVNLTDYEINNLPFIKWIRQALIAERGEQLRNANLAVTVKNLDNFVEYGYTNDPVGFVKRWVGNDTFIIINRGEILVANNKLIWFTPTGVLFETIFSTNVDPRLMTSCKDVGSMTRSEYTAMVNAELQQSHAATTFTAAPDATSPSLAGVRFTRH